MRFMRKRIVSILLASCMVFSMAPQSVFASEEQIIEETTTEVTTDEELTTEEVSTVEPTTEETNQEEENPANVDWEIPTEDVTDVIAITTEEATEEAGMEVRWNTVELGEEVSRFNYVQIEYSEMIPTETQIVTVSVLDGTKVISSATLTYVNEQGTEYVANTFTQDEDKLLFSFQVGEVGTYTLKKINYTTDEGAFEAVFADWNSEASFKVVNELEADIIQDAAMKAQEDAQIDEAFQAELYDQVSGTRKKEKTYTVVIDPGHDKRHGGAIGNGINEQRSTVIIALAMKKKLEEYENIKVYLTHSDGTCPVGASLGTNGDCLRRRCDYAAEKKADIMVSLHLNSGASAANGCLVIAAKKAGYRDDVAQKTQDAGNAVLTELSGLGLRNRGLMIRTSDTDLPEYHYENGVWADWYAITRNTMKLGIPGIIVEHAFLSSPYDAANFLNTDEKLRRLGEADAIGIIKYLGAEKPAKKIKYPVIESNDPYLDRSINVQRFIADLYENCLGRVPTIGEVSWWANYVVENEPTGSDLAAHFFFSPESINTNKEDDAFVESMYKSLMGRPSDPEGKKFWIDVIRSKGRKTAFFEMAGCDEYLLKCRRYGMRQGSYELQYRKVYLEVSAIVSRYYTGFMGRAVDEAGLEYWVTEMVYGMTAAELTKHFIASAEFRDMRVSKEDFVEKLYVTMLGRKSDPSGKAHWVKKLYEIGWDNRNVVIADFLYSPEFRELCQKANVEVGKL